MPPPARPLPDSRAGKTVPADRRRPAGPAAGDPLSRAAALAALQALANGTRLDLVRALIVAGPEGIAAGDLAARLGLAPSGLSFHLATLEAAGLIGARRVARHIFYTADPTGLGRTIAFLMQDCCAEDPRVRACCDGGPARPAPTP